MYRDKIVEEVRKARKQMVAEAGGAAHLGEYIRRRQAESGATYVRLKPKRAKRKKRPGK